MTPDRTQPDKPLSLESLEAQLRQLPRPQVPGHLEDRLIAAIPTVQPASKAAHQSIRRYLLPVASLAACLALAALALHSWNGSSDSASKSAIVTPDALQQRMAREASSARLLAAAKILEQFPEGRAEAKRNYERIATAYADTDVAKQINKENLFDHGETQ